MSARRRELCTHSTLAANSGRSTTWTSRQLMSSAASAVAPATTWSFVLLFFFQAEDGIRDLYVTGVQTCALPISRIFLLRRRRPLGIQGRRLDRAGETRVDPDRPGGGRRRCRWNGCAPEKSVSSLRSEERRVGKECRYRWWRYDYKKRV